MKKILFIHEGKASLPEILAYKEFFLSYGDYYAEDLVLKENLDEKLLKYIDSFDVIWKFMGMDRNLKISNSQVLVHEYASLSTKPFPALKNFLKTKFNQKPDLRVFLNEAVRENLQFNDSVPYCYRDMGISSEFYPQNVEKKYNFVYLGDISKKRKINKLLEYFSKHQNLSLLLIGPYSEQLFLKYNSCPNIHFKGKVDNKDVPTFCSQAKYAINFIPNSYPYNIQTSTKLLEYLSLGLKIITTHGEWVELFEKNNSCKFYYINENQIEIPDNLDSFDLKSDIDNKKLRWNNIISKSNLKQKLDIIIEEKRSSCSKYN